MVANSHARALILIASIIGCLQGLLTFVGGCVATYDKHNDANAFSLGDAIGDMKYSCGFMKLNRLPDNINESTRDCDKYHGLMDRGWYSRVHKYCLECNGDECNVAACDLNGFGVVLAYAIVCGCGWFLLAVSSFIGFLLNHKKTVLVATIGNIVFYIIFIGLFCAAWVSVKKMDKECLNKACKEVQKQGKRSSREFLGYSICSFITILATIIFGVIGIPGLGKPAKTNEKEKPDCYVPEEIKVVEKVEKTGVIGREHIYQFKQLNNYIADKEKLRKYAKKKFKEADSKNNLGKLAMAETEEFIIKLLQKKSLPLPEKARIQSLVRRYDTNETNNIENTEFEQLLFDTFVASRELLITKYSIKKANSWRFNKTFVTVESSVFIELENLLNNSDDFYGVLEDIARGAGNNVNSILSTDKVTEIMKIFCEKYAIPTLSNNEITEVMQDMGKKITEYDANDLRMAALTVISILRNLTK